MNRPRVVIHAAVSLDGRTDGFAADHAALRRLAATWPAARVIDGADPLAAELLGQGLVDEVSLLVHPVIAGEGHASWSGGARLPDGVRLVRRSTRTVVAGEGAPGAAGVAGVAAGAATGAAAGVGTGEQAGTGPVVEPGALAWLRFTTEGT